MTDANPKVAVVGVGYWGRNLARNFAELGALAGVVDQEPATARSVAEATSSQVLTLSEVLADRAIAGIAIATRAETHAEVAEAALRADKHVFVEKPLVLHEDEAEPLIELAGKRRLILMVGHLLRHHPIFQRMVEIVSSGELGALRYIHSDRMSMGKIRSEENVLWSFAPHDISMILALAGQEVRTVTAQGAAFVNSRIEDVVTMQLAFRDGVRADIRASWMNYCKVHRIAAICDRGTAVFEDSEPEWDRKLAIYEHEIEMANDIPVPRKGAIRHVAVPPAEPLKRECQHFLDRIVDGTQPLTDGREGQAVLRVLQQATASLEAAGRDAHN